MSGFKRHENAYPRVPLVDDEIDRMRHEELFEPIGPDDEVTEMMAIEMESLKDMKRTMDKIRHNVRAYELQQRDYTTIGGEEGERAST
ncbi:MAG: hypothetical protein HYS81_01470 [Candidatus Aenigmatarchaeota archaeon]|nr:MAG: hypothetical protein HYS81_01470 [Candidatus Aenigmarchaeota archaeon]